MADPDGFDDAGSDPKAYTKCCVNDPSNPSASFDKYFNGFVRITAFTWHSERSYKFIEYIYEGRLDRGLTNFRGFGRFLDASQNKITTGYFNGFKAIHGQFI